MKLVLTLQLVDDEGRVVKERKGELNNHNGRKRVEVLKYLRVGVITTYQSLCPPQGSKR